MEAGLPYPFVRARNTRTGTVVMAIASAAEAVRKATTELSSARALSDTDARFARVHISWLLSNRERLEVRAVRARRGRWGRESACTSHARWSARHDNLHLQDSRGARSLDWKV